MSEGEAQSVVIGTIAAAILAPLLAAILSRVFPPRAVQPNSTSDPRDKLRNRVIEYAGVAFFIAGMSVPFALQGTDRLEPTTTNIAMIFSYGVLGMVGGVATLAALLGDRNAESFLEYFERERRISRKGARLTARVMVAAAIIGLVAVLIRG